MQANQHVNPMFAGILNGFAAGTVVSTQHDGGVQVHNSGKKNDWDAIESVMNKSDPNGPPPMYVGRWRGDAAEQRARTFGT